MAVAQQHHTAVPLVPPDAFGCVEPGIYRSNMLQPANFMFIKSLGLKRVIILSPESPARPVLTFLEENEIGLIQLGIRTWQGVGNWKPVSEELIKEGLELVLDARFHPTLLMCSSGIHQTGTFVGCLRKLQRWNFNSIITEYRSFAGIKSRYNNEQFIELFDLDLVTLPPYLPAWFTHQMRMMADDEAEARRRAKVSRDQSAVSLPTPTVIQPN